MGGTIIAKPSDPSKMGGGMMACHRGRKNGRAVPIMKGAKEGGGEGRRVKAILGGGGLELERPGA